MGGYRTLTLIGLIAVMCAGMVHFAVTQEAWLFAGAVALASIGIVGYAIFGPDQV